MNPTYYEKLLAGEWRCRPTGARQVFSAVNKRTVKQLFLRKGEETEPVTDLQPPIEGKNKRRELLTHRTGIYLMVTMLPWLALLCAIKSLDAALSPTDNLESPSSMHSIEYIQIFHNCTRSTSRWPCIAGSKAFIWLPNTNKRKKLSSFWSTTNSKPSTQRENQKPWNIQGRGHSPPLPKHFDRQTIMIPWQLHLQQDPEFESVLVLPQAIQPCLTWTRRHYWLMGRETWTGVY